MGVKTFKKLSIRINTVSETISGLYLDNSKEINLSKYNLFAQINNDGSC